MIQKSYFSAAKKLRLKSICYLFLLLLVSMATFAQQTIPQNETAWTLEQCLKWAANNNIQIKQAELAAKISKNSYLQSKLNLLPTISGDASYSFNFGNSVNPTTFAFSQVNSQSASMGLNGSLPLFTGLQQLNNINKSKYDLLGNKYDYENTVNNTALTITNYFLNIVVNRELLKVAEKQLEISTEQLARAKKQSTVGTLAEASVYEFDAQKARDEASLTNAKNNLEITLLTLKIALQLADKEKFNVLIPDLKADNLQDLNNLSANSIYDFALNNQPSIKSTEAKLKSAQYTEKIAKGTLSPTVSVSFSLRDNYFDRATEPTNFSYYLTDINQSTPIYKDFSSSNPVDNIVGFDRLKVKYDEVKTPTGTQLKNNLTKAVNFNLSVPIFSGWKKMTNIANSKLQFQITKLNLDAAKNKLRQDIEQAYTTVKAASQNYFANERSYESSKKSYEAFDKRFNVGLSNNFELQQARTNLNRAESQMIQAKYNYIFNLKVLDFYQGKPITLN